ncbi:unnamed protein product, partial [marine sediment metagenome]
EEVIVTETDEGDNDATHLSRIQKLKQFTSAVKSKRSYEFIQDVVDGEEKIVVFTEYIATTESIKEHFEDCAVVFTGKKNMNEKQEAVDKFMNDKNTSVFIGTNGAAGVGITLTSSSILLFIDKPWTPADVEQCYSRIFRLGSTAE